jgi:hypothetical protein
VGERGRGAGGVKGIRVKKYILYICIKIDNKN